MNPRRFWIVLVCLSCGALFSVIQLNCQLRGHETSIVYPPTQSNFIAKLALHEAILHSGIDDPPACLEEILNSGDVDMIKENNSSIYHEFKKSIKERYNKCLDKFRTIDNVNFNDTPRQMWRKYWDTNSNVSLCRTNETELRKPNIIELSPEPPTYRELFNMYPEIYRGGFYPGPEECVPTHSTVIIIPFRDRDVHLRYWLHYMIRVLLQQKIRFMIVVAEQEGGGTFNKGQIMNTGFLWAKKHFPTNWDCYVFHDVDMISEIASNMYTCNKDTVNHLTPYTDKFQYSMAQTGVTIGGAMGMTGEQFESVNGYSNYFYGWGGEDDDMYARIIALKYKVVRPKSPTIGRYTMIRHKKDKENPLNPQRHRLLKTTKERRPIDGLNNLPTTISVVLTYPLFTRLKIKILDKSIFNLDEVEEKLKKL